ncbi:COX5B-domain-containing protein [Patellaria atrata CBS 101060]|uniref:Cytochrome c oxidase subunit 4, mitochondrial n=1 Tax=Patellaria atrata CBS 101060 TaxID=1346257 RepID=A0A9P4SFM3_9PEZI|nr:COX5B-domain-containing protein [Patellaria atrata CBS 101060]
MLVQRSAFALARRVAFRPATTRTFTSSVVLRLTKDDPSPGGESKTLKKFEDIKSMEDLIPPGAKPGTVPTDMEQATGLERLELLGKMQGVDIFDMKPLDSSRKGTLDDPIIVRSFGDEQYAGCTGFPADSHVVKWLTMSRARPVERCTECGNVLKMEYVGPQEDPHHDDHGHGDHHTYEEPKTMADFVRPEYR